MPMMAIRVEELECALVFQSQPWTKSGTNWKREDYGKALHLYLTDTEILL